MLLVVEARILRLEVRRELREDDVSDAVDGSFVRGAAVPDLDQVGGEAAGEGDAAEVVSWVVMVSFRRSIRDCFRGGAAYHSRARH